MTAVTLSRPDWPTHWGPAPRFATPRNPERASFGPAIARTAEHLGQALFPFQAYIADVANEIDPVTGGWAYDDIAILLPRRSGKTHMVKVIVAHRCSRGPTLAMITAQTREHAVERWADLVTSAPLKGLLHSPLGPTLTATVGTSKESLRWGNGSRFRPFAPNAEANHGGEPDLVFVDELWAFDLVTKREIEQGYRPAWSVKPGQAWHLSAAGTARSLWLKQVRARGRQAVTDPLSRMAFFEWSVPPEAAEGLQGGALVDLVREYHPRRDHGLRAGYLSGELDNLGRAGFLRAYGNVDEDGDGAALAIDESSWRARGLLGVQPPPGARVCVAVACDPAGRESTVAVAWVDDWGRSVTQTVKHGPGVIWAQAYGEAVGQGVEVGLVVTSNAGLGRTIAAGVGLHRMTKPDLSAAALAWSEGVTDAAGAVFHDGSAQLERALRNADAPEGQGWVSRTGEPLTVLESHSMALWGLARLPEPEPAPARFKIF